MAAHRSREQREELYRKIKNSSNLTELAKELNMNLGTLFGCQNTKWFRELEASDAAAKMMNDPDRYKVDTLVQLLINQTEMKKDLEDILEALGRV